jgi:hypothetical protein
MRGFTVWYGMVWYGMVWYGMVWYGMVWYGMVWYGIRVVARLFQQVRYSHEITILLQPCIVNLVTFLLYHDYLCVLTCVVLYFMANKLEMQFTWSHKCRHCLTTVCLPSNIMKQLTLSFISNFVT